MTAKEQQIADTLACPNCGNKKFTETSINAALGFRCDCGLEFNFMPILKQVEIIRDPYPGRLWSGEDGDYIRTALVNRQDDVLLHARYAERNLGRTFVMAVVGAVVVLVLLVLTVWWYLHFPEKP